MSSRFDLIAQQLLQKPFSDCSIAELQQLTEAYPFLAPAHFLLAKKLQHEGGDGAGALIQKAALYYHQPAFFDAFLNSDFDEAFLYADNEAKESLEDGYDQEQEDDLNDEYAPPVAITAAPVEEVALQPEPEEERAPALTPEAPAPATPELREQESQIFEEQPMPAPTTEAPLAAPAALAAIEYADEPPAPAAEAKPTVEQTEGLPTFEPYHTIDYFASMGIRLSQEEAGKDKMGKQLKSFTEWLKTMKRLPATEQVKVLDLHAEKKVENLAAHSVAETEIVTEAMAEVWLKQGALDKAVAVYHKLSLAHPSKSAYFAAKLESLKKKI